MSERIYSETLKQRDGIDSMLYGRTQTDHKVTIWEDENKVSLVSSRLIVGVPRGHENKRYYYWRSVHSFGFRRTKHGTIVAFQCSRPWDGTVRAHWKHSFPMDAYKVLDYAEGEEYADVFKDSVWRRLGIRSSMDMYPMLNHYNLRSPHLVPGDIRSAFRLDNIYDFASMAFGKTRATPRLVAAVADTDPYFVSYARQFRGIVQDEKLVGFLERNKFDDEMEEHFRPHNPDIRKSLLKHPNIAKHLIGQTLDMSDIRRVQYMTRFGKDGSEIYFNAFPKATTLSDLIQSVR